MACVYHVIYIGIILGNNINQYLNYLYIHSIIHYYFIYLSKNSYFYKS